MIRYGGLLIQRDGRIWQMPQRRKLGTVHRPGSGWQAECEQHAWWRSPIQGTRKDAIYDLIGHWNDGEENTEALTDGSER